MREIGAPFRLRQNGLYYCEEGEGKNPTWVVASPFEERANVLEKILRAAGVGSKGVESFIHRYEGIEEYGRLVGELCERGAEKLAFGCRNGVSTIKRVASEDFLRLRESLENEGLYGSKLLPLESLGGHILTTAKTFNGPEELDEARAYLKSRQFAKAAETIENVCGKGRALSRADYGSLSAFDDVLLRLNLPAQSFGERGPVPRVFPSYSPAIVGSPTRLGEFELFDLCTRPIGIGSIPYGASSGDLISACAKEGAEKILMTGSVGAFSGTKNSLQVGDLVTPAEFIDRGSRRGSFAKLQGAPGGINETVHYTFPSVAEETRHVKEWMRGRGVETVDCEFGHAERAARESGEVSLEIVGVVTDIMNRKGLGKLVSEKTQGEKISDAFAKRDLLTLDWIHER